MIMPNHIKPSMNILDFQYAYLSRGKSWEVIFWQVNPLEFNLLQRARIRINRIAIANREKYGLKLCEEINKKLDGGEWNYWIEKNNAHEIAPSIDIFINSKRRRPASNNSYKSRYNLFSEWLREFYPKIKYLHQITPDLTTKYFTDHLIPVKNYSERTYNNANLELRVIFNYFVEKNFIKINPFKAVKFVTEDEKFRVDITREDLNKLFEYLIVNDKPFYIICSLIYFGLIRRTEITRLQMFMIDWKLHHIKLPGSITKNHRNKVVVIPDAFYQKLIEFEYHKLPGDYFICSNGVSCSPGLKKIAGSRVSEKWRSVADKLKFPREYQFYSLKDTGNTHMEEAGISSPTIRDQAGWRNIQQRNTYTHTTGEALKKLRDFKAGDGG